ncbi:MULTISPECIES: polysaccharide deacetylase family protein [unclassified Rathayibacter]|uniref:polysaccharide deacetylase family protein n=1 Tax=unclassified Rathayibacter TaxID=2609250 RepID=UPI00188C4AEF|nr:MULTISPECIES: polysaccharide deacetylase family protein [unclassified Rathayibacter]MBF4461332.1 polysaccharide deacetylase family protein [Rathayibacter sp. VKM Ac-2879]MBF4502743.1 polysaccharide deacetylase family protein [Rathayibacter sp. VKM Ac-2878]
MDSVRRRALLVAIAASAVGLTACTPERPPLSAAPSGVAPAVVASAAPPPPPRPVPSVTAAPSPVRARVPLPGGVISELPGDGKLIAWTVDDGADSDVVAAYAQFAKDSGTRLTFFLNGKYDSWTTNAPTLAPLVASGQVQLANHTYSHADLTSLSTSGIQEELGRNGDFIRSTYGVEAAPFYRPPYGYTDERSRAAAAAIGYTAPTLWYGSLSDSGLITPEQIVGFANQWFLPQHIVIGHANFTPVTTVYAKLVDILHERSLETVTLRDVFAV